MIWLASNTYFEASHKF